MSLGHPWATWCQTVGSGLASTDTRSPEQVKVAKSEVTFLSKKPEGAVGGWTAGENPREQQNCSLS